MREARFHPRVPLRCEVSWNGSNTRPGITTDISRGGCYIESIVQVAVGEVLHCKLQLAPGHSLEFEGEVRYVHPTLGFGLRFRYLTNAQLKVLLRLIGSARADQSTGQITLMTDRSPTRVAA
jgi:PilZ domain